MTATAQLTAERLREVMNYDPNTGEFRWKMATGPRAKVGEVAGNANSSGYIRIGIDGIRHRAHRLAWLYVHGSLPPLGIDHKYGNTSDNSIDNLRPANQQQQNANKISRNQHGYKGIYPSGRGWAAQIMVNSKNHYLGTFDTKEEAAIAYIEAAQKHFGEFAHAPAFGLCDQDEDPEQ